MRNLGAEIIHSNNLELKGEEPYKKLTEEKNEKKQASNPSSEEHAEKNVAEVKSLEYQVTEVGHFVDEIDWYGV